MANCEKIKTDRDVRGLIAHNNREIEQNEKSGGNYKLIERQQHEYDSYKQRLKEVYAMKRADLVKAISWVVTQPKEYAGDSQQFFKIVSEFMCEHFGADNVIQGWVHLDEETPHAHFLIVPVTEDKKRHVESGLKLNASEYTSRKAYRNFHPAMQRYLTEHGIMANINTGITREKGNRSISELKRETELEELKNRIYTLEKEVEELRSRERTRATERTWGNTW